MQCDAMRYDMMRRDAMPVAGTDGGRAVAADYRRFWRIRQVWRAAIPAVLWGSISGAAAGGQGRAGLL